jgi:hypothetical protein
MLSLILAIASSALVSIIMRFSDRKVTGNIAMLTVNYLMCLIVSAGYTGFGNLFPKVEGLPGALLMGSINGLLYLGGFVLLAIWLHESCGWGTWVVWAGMILGISGAIGGLADTIRSMNRLIRTQEKKNEPPLAFNDHD